MSKKTKSASLWLGLLLAFGLSLAARADTLTIGGTGSSEPLVRLLYEEFRKQAKDVSLNLVTPPLGTGGGLKALAEGRLDLAIAGRPLKPEEAARFGRSFELADTPFVLASSGGQRRNGFSLDELAAVYDGSLRKWDGGSPIRLILRATFESDTLLLKSMSPAMAKALDQAAQRPGMVTGKDDMETLALITQTPGSFGPTTLGLITTAKEKLTIFPINGVTPSVTTLKNGSYPWSKSLIVVLPPSPSPAAERFAQFLRSGKVRALLQRYDYRPAE
ncbi:phosphate ABC transporter substrate-binding protein [Denitratisoma sp. agr-D3]